MYNIPYQCQIMHNIYFDRLLRNQPQETQKAQEETQEEEGSGGGLCCSSGGRGRVRGRVRRGGPKDQAEAEDWWTDDGDKKVWN